MIVALDRPTADEFADASNEWTLPVVSYGVAEDWPVLLDTQLDRAAHGTVAIPPDTEARRTWRPFRHLALRQVAGTSNVIIVPPTGRFPWSRNRRHARPVEVELHAGSVLLVPHRYRCKIVPHTDSWSVRQWWSAGRRHNDETMAALTGLATN